MLAGVVEESSSGTNRQPGPASTDDELDLALRNWVAAGPERDASEGCALVEAACWDQQHRLTEAPQLFEFPPAALRMLLRRNLSGALRHPDCPSGLADRIRRPYDLATLELALPLRRRRSTSVACGGC